MSNDLHTAWIDGTTQYKAADMNKPLAELDRAIQSIGQLVVADKDLTSPPGSPTDGAAYIVGTGATGDWSTHDGDVAYYDGDNSAWKFATPVEGWTAYVQDEDVEYRFDGSAWVRCRPYIVAGYFPGQPAAGAIMLRLYFSLAVRLPQNLTGSQFKAATAATAQAAFDIQKNGSSIGTATFSAAATSASFTFSADVDFSAGDYLDIVAPASQDATLADICISLKGSR
jgi:hypothetical protein